MSIRVEAPPTRSPALTDQGTLHRTWTQWLGNLQRSLGWDKTSPVYSDILTLPVEFMLTDASSDNFGAFGQFLCVPSAASGTTSYHFSTRLPNTYKDGTDIVPTLIWTPDDTNIANVVWALDIAKASLGIAFAALAQDMVTVATGGTTLGQQHTEFSAIDGSTYVAGDMLKGAISRQGDEAADTYASVTYPLALVLRYRVEGVGKELSAL